MAYFDEVEAYVKKSAKLISKGDETYKLYFDNKTPRAFVIEKSIRTELVRVVYMSITSDRSIIVSTSTMDDIKHEEMPPVVSVIGEFMLDQCLSK
jgi:hypothetical protein